MARVAVSENPESSTASRTFMLALIAKGDALTNLPFDRSAKVHLD
jgi:hypothetical protein